MVMDIRKAAANLSDQIRDAESRSARLHAIEDVLRPLVHELDALRVLLKPFADSVTYDHDGVGISTAGPTEQDWIDAHEALKGEPAPTLNVSCGCMIESGGRKTWLVHLYREGTEPFLHGYQIYTDAIEGRARYEAARLEHFLGLGPRPDILKFDTAAPQPPKGFRTMVEIAACIPDFKMRLRSLAMCVFAATDASQVKAEDAPVCSRFASEAFYFQIGAKQILELLDAIDAAGRAREPDNTIADGEPYQLHASIGAEDDERYTAMLGLLRDAEGSISIPDIQRIFECGYNPASRLLERLVKDGIVSAERNKAHKHELLKRAPGATP